jgi:CubicO group peptidase (beta-lactamase class C family)
LVIQGGKTILEDYGNGGGRRQTVKIFSGTKGFWVLCALKAVSEGILSLEEKVANTISEWRDQRGKDQVTVRQLLTFCSGLDAANELHGDGFEDRDAIALRTPLVGPVGRSFIYGPAALQVFHELFKRKLAPRSQTPTQYLERQVLAPLGLGPQRYLADQRGNPLLATGFMMTARHWARLGQLILEGGAPVIPATLLAECFQGTGPNPAFGMGFWNNFRSSRPRARVVDVEETLEPKWDRQNWNDACLSREAPPDLVAGIGSGNQRLFVIPSLGLVVVRQGAPSKFSDAEFLRILLG